jgi:dipeptidyl aminopeptidase/acylaminoacyl peptidase
MNKLLSIALTLPAIIAGTCSAQAYNINDSLSFAHIASVVASPDGNQVAIITRQNNRNNWRYTLYLRNKKGSSKIIAKASGLGSVDWSANGKNIAYLADNNGQQTLFVYQLNTKKNVPIVKQSQSIDALKWSPSGKKIAFVAEEKSPIPPKNTLINQAKNYVNSQLFLINNVRQNATIKPITSANYSISSGVFGGGFDWSPNSKNIAFSFQPSAMTIDGKKSKVAIINLASHQLHILPFCQTHTCYTPMYSPNGQWLAFASNILSNAKAKTLLEDIDKHAQICLVNKKGKIHCLDSTFNKIPLLIGWNKNSNAVFVGDLYKVDGPTIYELNENPNITTKLISNKKGFIDPNTISLNATNTLFGFGLETVNKAPEAFTASTKNFKMTQLTHLNNHFDKPLGKVKVLNWISTDRTKIQGLLITPINYNPKHKYPLYVDIHGGPSSAQSIRYLGGCEGFGEAVAPVDCPANILSLGYIILQVNYRGSTGYGLKFRMKNFGDFGGGDFHDIISGVNKLVSQGHVNPKKIVIAGWSAGGYLTPWIISHSNLFSKAIEGDGITDLISYTGTSDDSDFFYRYLGFYFWNDKNNAYWKQSPMAYVKKIQTPLLILQGGQDSRVPPTQSQELYTALTTLHKPVTMLVDPNRGHEPANPATILGDIKAINLWLTKAP